MGKLANKNVLQNPYKSIGLIVDCLSFGGAERSAAIASRVFTKAGYDVMIISLQDEVSYLYSGQLEVLGGSGSIIKLLSQYQKVRKFKKLVQSNPNRIWIDYRMRNHWWMEFVLYHMIFKNQNIIYTTHSFNIDYHMPKGNFFKEVYAKATVVSVSKGIQSHLKTKKGINSVYIPNPLDNEYISIKAEAFSVTDHYIIAVGRLLNDVKQYDVLIDAYAISNLKAKGIGLKILGDGPDYYNLKEKISNLNLIGAVELLGFVENPYPYIKNAKFLCLTSKFEGLPVVILEALSLKTPVVAFDCPSGPSEMIINNENGILVENQNTKGLVEALNKLSDDPNLLKRLSDANPEIDLKPYSLSQHLKSWELLFETL